MPCVGGFDSVVNAVRDAVGLVHDQSNFEDVPYVQWDKWSLDPDVYNFGKLLVGQGRQCVDSTMLLPAFGDGGMTC